MKTKPNPEIESAVNDFLAYHADEIKSNPAAARCARKIKSDLQTGRLNNPKTNKVLLHEGRLCGIHLAIEQCLESLFAEAA